MGYAQTIKEPKDVNFKTFLLFDYLGGEELILSLNISDNSRGNVY